MEDARVAIAARLAERDALVADRDLGLDARARLAEIDDDLAQKRAALARLEAEWETERGLVAEITRLRGELGRDGAGSGEAGTALVAQAAALEQRDPEGRMIYAHVDAQAVASVVSDWTGSRSAGWCATRSRPSCACPRSSTGGWSASRTACR